MNGLHRSSPAAVAGVLSSWLATLLLLLWPLAAPVAASPIPEPDAVFYGNVGDTDTATVQIESQEGEILATSPVDANKEYLLRVRLFSAEPAEAQLPAGSARVDSVAKLLFDEVVKTENLSLARGVIRQITFGGGEDCFVDEDCDDGVFCNGQETCDPLSVCQAGSDPCNAGECDEGEAICRCNIDADCDDGVACTVDSCVTASCTHIPNHIVCNNGNVCTDDSCGAFGCAKAFNTAACDDGDVCTENDTCNFGVCGGAQLGCDDGNECTDDSCGVAGCTNTDNTVACDDGDGCTENDTCADGVCSGILSVFCGKCAEGPGEPPAVRLRGGTVAPGGITSVCMLDVMSNGTPLTSLSGEFCIDSSAVEIRGCQAAAGVPDAVTTELAVLDPQEQPGCYRLQVATDPATPLEDGCVVECTLAVSAQAGTELPVSNSCTAEQSGGGDAEACCQSGSVTVAGACGDFSGDSLCKINEITKCVNCFLQQQPEEGCAASDCNCDAQTRINELTQCVNCYLGGFADHQCSLETALHGSSAGDNEGPGLLRVRARGGRVGRRLALRARLSGAERATAFAADISFDPTRLRVRRVRLPGRLAYGHELAWGRLGGEEIRLGVFSTQLELLKSGKTAVIVFKVRRHAAKGPTDIDIRATVATSDGRELALETRLVPVVLH